MKTAENSRIKKRQWSTDMESKKKLNTKLQAIEDIEDKRTKQKKFYVKEKTERGET